MLTFSKWYSTISLPFPVVLCVSVFVCAVMGFYLFSSGVYYARCNAEHNIKHLLWMESDVGFAFLLKKTHKKWRKFDISSTIGDMIRFLNGLGISRERKLVSQL